MPPADIPVDRALVERLVRQQHPDLAGELTLIDNGWDNAIYRLGDELCVRMPRRRAAVELTLKEQTWLPVLATQVSTPISAPVRIGAPTEDFPWPWSICPWFEGRSVAEIPPAQRRSVAADLATFMAELHTPAPADAPGNPVRGVPLDSRDKAVHRRLETGTIPRAGELRALWERLKATPPWQRPPLWIHGDPHSANMLTCLEPTTGATGLVAVIDFGDLTSGDPATDLAAAWMVFDPEGRAIFRDHLDRLARLDDHTWARAKGWAVNMGTAIVTHSDDFPRLARIGHHTLGQVLLPE